MGSTSGVPSVVTTRAAGRVVRLLWENELGGLTFAIGDPPQQVIKWNPSGNGLDLRREVVRLGWAARWIMVPEVVDHGDDGSWMVTGALPGESAVSERWLAEPAIAARSLGAGLRLLHDALPVAECPYSWMVEDRVADAIARSERGELVRTAGVGPVDGRGRALGVEDGLAVVRDLPEPDRLVVCHGDACAPNTLLEADGTVLGHVDLGALGVADRWADLAVASWSLEWNYGPGREDLFFEGYGIEPDEDRLRYYRILWDLGP